MDSVVDITSGVVIWATSRAITKTDPYHYPVGRTRLEPIALTIVSVIMAVASVQMIVQSLESVINDRIDPHVDMPTLIIMVTFKHIVVERNQTLPRSALSASRSFCSWPAGGKSVDLFDMPEIN